MKTLSPEEQLKQARENALEALRAGDGNQYERWMKIVRPLARAAQENEEADSSK